MCLRHFFDTFASCSSVTGETVARTGGVVASTTTGAILASLSTEARVNDAINVELVQTGAVHTGPSSGTDSSVELKLLAQRRRRYRQVRQQMLGIRPESSQHHGIQHHICNACAFRCPRMYASKKLKLLLSAVCDDSAMEKW